MTPHQRLHVVAPTLQVFHHWTREHRTHPRHPRLAAVLPHNAERVLLGTWEPAYAETWWDLDDQRQTRQWLDVKALLHTRHAIRLEDDELDQWLIHTAAQHAPH